MWDKIKNTLLSKSLLASATTEIRLTDLGIAKPLAGFWANYTRRQVEFHLRDAVLQDNAAIAATKFGGNPDLISPQHWPISSVYRRKIGGVDLPPRPLEFLCQINFADVAWAKSSDLPIPDMGLLSVFYDNEQQPWGFDPAERSGARMIYTPPGAVLQRVDGQAFGFASARPVCTAELKHSLSLPDYTNLDSLIEIDGAEQADRLCELVEELYDEDEAINDVHSWAHSFGGWPVHIQTNDMRQECQLAFHGLDCGTPEDYKTEQAIALSPGAIDWWPLLQLDSEDQLEWFWGSSGRLYWWARQADIQAANFDNSWTVLQCT
jgi:uncharacterized protein YwqG